jgi:arylsulfatase B
MNERAPLAGPEVALGSSWGVRFGFGWASIAALMGCRAESPPAESGEVLDATEVEVVVPPRNVLVVLLDDVSPWQLEAYAEHPTPAVTPTISRLAAEGLLFQRFYAMPTCSPTRAAALTGRYGRRFDIGRWLNVDDAWELPLAELTIAEVLSAAPVPYETHAVGKWHVATKESDPAYTHPLRQGFKTYRGSPANLGLVGDFFEFFKVEADGTTTTATTYATTDEIDDAIEVIAAAKGPFFVWLGLHAPHLPFHIAPAELRTTDVKFTSHAGVKVLGAIEAIDHELGRLLESVDPDVLANTDVFVLGDNGAAAGAVLPPLVAGGGKGTVYEGGTRVPLIVWGPDVGQPGTQTHALAHVTDLFPTIAAIAGAGFTHEIDGHDLLPTIRGEADQGRDFVYLEAFFPNGPGVERESDERAVRDADWKLVHVQGSPPELYRLDHPLAEGADCLPGPLEPDAQEAYDRLSAELSRVEASLGILSQP